MPALLEACSMVVGDGDSLERSDSRAAGTLPGPRECALNQDAGQMASILGRAEAVAPKGEAVGIPGECGADRTRVWLLADQRLLDVRQPRRALGGPGNCDPATLDGAVRGQRHAGRHAADGVER